MGGGVDQIGDVRLRQCVESKVKAGGVEQLASSVDTTPETLKLIIDGLTQPPGFDMRQSKTDTPILTQLILVRQYKKMVKTQTCFLNYCVCKIVE